MMVKNDVDDDHVDDHNEDDDDYDDDDDGDDFADDNISKVANLLRLFRIPQISPASTAKALSDKTKFVHDEDDNECDDDWNFLKTKSKKTNNNKILRKI